MKRTDEQIDRILPEVLASLELEGVFLAREEKELVRSRLRGESCQREFPIRGLEL